MAPEVREKVLAQKWGAVGLIQDRLANILAMADVAEKQASVLVDVVTGTCPQHFMMIAIFGDTASVKSALESIENMNK